MIRYLYTTLGDELTMNRYEMIIQIGKYFEKIERNIDFLNGTGYTDINTSLENTYCGLLNLVYDYDLKNANEENFNQKAYDLIDRKNKICFQVTSTKIRNKIQKTLDKFEQTKESETCHIKIMIMGKKVNYRKDFDYHGANSFDKKEDIIDNNDLFMKINCFDVEKINKILLYLKKEIDGSDFNVDLNNYVKKENISIDFFTKRRAFKNDKQGHYFDKGTDIDELIKKRENIFLVGDAGIGKSEVCKYLFNMINKEKNQFPLYYKLLNYTGESIEKIKEKEFQDLPNRFVVFIFDGFDEISDNYKSVFIKEMKKFISKNENTLIIISSRYNFYKKGDKWLNNFQKYFIAPFDNNNIKELAEYYKIEYIKFMNQVNKHSFDKIIYNPFYAKYLINYYVMHHRIPTKSVLIDSIIEESFTRDEEKYETTQQLNEDRKKLKKILKLLSISMAMLERNYITNDEFESLIDNKNDRKLLDYCSLWVNEKNKKMFLHNLFFEYLASQELSHLKQDAVEKMVCYENGTFNPYWINIFKFYLESKNDVALLDWVIDLYPNFIFYLEKDNLSSNKREQVFKKIFEYYEEKRIWLPNDIYRNRNFFDLIQDTNITEYLLTKLTKDHHFTTIYNALVCLRFISKYNRNVQTVQYNLINIDTFDYNVDSKRLAILILSQHKMITIDEMKKIEKANSNVVNKKMISSYYTYFETNRLDENNIDYFLHFLHLGIRNFNYSEFNCLKSIFLNIKYENVVSKIIDFYENESLITINEGYIENICHSIQNLNIDSNKKYNLFLRLIRLSANNYSQKDVNIVLKYMKNDKFKLKLFHEYLNSQNLMNNCEITNLIDNECLEYFYQEYFNKIYSDAVAEDFLLLCFDDFNNFYYYQEINRLCLERTNKNIIKIKKENLNRNELRTKEIKEYLDSIFDKEIFKRNIEEFLLKNEINNLCNKNQLRQIRRKIKNEKEILLCDFLITEMSERKDMFIQLNSLEWKKVILYETYHLMDDNKEFSLSSGQKEQISNICLEYLKNYSFKGYAKNERNGNYKNLMLYFCLWYFKRKLDINYPEHVLLDMLEVDFSFMAGTDNSIDYIINVVSEIKVRERIIYNLENKCLSNGVLENHIKYCIDHHVSGLDKIIEKYLKDKKIYNKDLLVDYILENRDINYIKENLLDKLDFETQINFIDKIYEENSSLIMDYIKKKCRYAKNEKKKSIYLYYLIKNKDIYGLNTFYKLLNKKMFYDDNQFSYNKSLSNALGMADSIDCLDIVLKIYLLCYDEKFVSKGFHTLIQGCRDAFVQMALSDVSNGTNIAVITRLEEFINTHSEIETIGFTNYTIDKIKLEHNLENHKEKNINEVINLVNKLFVKEKNIGLQY